MKLCHWLWTSPSPQRGLQYQRDLPEVRLYIQTPVFCAINHPLMGPERTLLHHVLWVDSSNLGSVLVS